MQSGAISPDEVSDWLANGPIGASKPYAVAGAECPRGLPGVEAVIAARDKGLVTCARRRIGQGRFEYVMQRVRVREAARRPTTDAALMKRQAEAEAAIFAKLRQCAAHRRPCPSNARLAEIAGLDDAADAQQIVSHFARVRRIFVSFVGLERRRVITIAASGASTQPERRS